MRITLECGNPKARIKIVVGVNQEKPKKRFKVLQRAKRVLEFNKRRKKVVKGYI